MRRARVAVSLALLATAAVGSDDLTPKETARALKLYNLKCAKCHKFYDPAGYTRIEWNDWMEKMARKSRLTREQNKLLSRYLETFRHGKD